MHVCLYMYSFHSFVNLVTPFKRNSSFSQNKSSVCTGVCIGFLKCKYLQTGDTTEEISDNADKVWRIPQQSMTNDPHKVWPGKIIPYQFHLNVGEVKYVRKLFLQQCLIMQPLKYYKLLNFLQRSGVYNATNIKHRNNVHVCIMHIYLFIYLF